MRSCFEQIHHTPGAMGDGGCSPRSTLSVLVSAQLSAVGFRRKLEIGWGEAFFGDDHDTVSRKPDQYLHTLAREHQTVLQKQTLLRQPLGFRVLANSSHVQLASLFLMFIRCCASGFRSIKNLLGSICDLHGICSVSYYPTTSGLAVCLPLSLQLQLLLLRCWGLCF